MFVYVCSTLSSKNSPIRQESIMWKTYFSLFHDSTSHLTTVLFTSTLSFSACYHIVLRIVYFILIAIGCMHWYVKHNDHTFSSVSLNVKCDSNSVFHKSVICCSFQFKHLNINNLVLKKSFSN